MTPDTVVSFLLCIRLVCHFKHLLNGSWDLGFVVSLVAQYKCSIRFVLHCGLLFLTLAYSLFLSLLVVTVFWGAGVILRPRSA